MSSFHGLQLALEQAQRLRDERAQQLARLTGQLTLLRAQLAQLESYAQETEKRWISGSHLHITGEMLRHHYQFMGRLEHAIALQGDVIASALREIEMAQKAQMQAEVRLHGLRNVMDSRRALLMKLAHKREQNQTDEFAALAHARQAALGEQYGD